MNQQAQATPRRKWRQFNLKTLLALLALAGIGLGRWCNSVARQREAVDTIKAAHGWVAYRHELEADEKRLEAQVPGPSWLRSLLGDDYFQTPVWLYHAGEVQATDELLAEMPKLPTLERVKIEGPFTGAGLRHLDGLPRLTELSILGRNLVDDDLVHLEGLKELELLTIDAPQLTDDALVHLRGLTRLKQLTLVGSFSDAGMRHLRGLANLQDLSCTTQPHLVQLAEPTAVEFEQTPLSESLQFLQERHHVDFRVDDLAFAAARLQPDQIAISVKVKGTLKGTLKLMLAPHRLDWTTDSGGIVITTSLAAEQRRTEILALQRLHPNLKRVEIDW